MKGSTKISELPAWIRVKAKTNIALDKRRGGDNKERKEDRLLYAFRWILTPEGYEYWYNIDCGYIPEKPNNNNG
jgi:hypothetical protein